MGSIIRRYIAYAIVIVFIVLIVYLMVGGPESAVDSYDTLTAKNKDSKIGFDKRKRYFTVAADGTITMTYGYGSETEQEKAEESESKATNTAAPGDFRELVKTMGQQMGTDDPSSHKIYSTPLPNGTYIYYEQQTITHLNPVVTIGDKSENVRPDCSGFVSAFLYFAGFESNLRTRTSYDFQREAQYDVIPLSELQVGDVMCRGGHVDVCVYKDSSTVYIADWGSPSQGYATATQGYWIPVGIQGTDITDIQAEFTNVYRPTDP